MPFHVLFLYSWKHKKTSGYLIFSGDIEKGVRRIPPDQIPPGESPPVNSPLVN